MLSGEKTANRLANEKSPYLLQHAHNPVDWMPWGEEAFDKAKAEDKPVFLSIGYSTCHWCHVMAHESFEDRAVAEVLNGGYICIKVDREERPDIDAVYMSVCQMLTGSGGWPLTIIMTPGQKPFWAGTYLPKRTAYGRLGLIELLSEVTREWTLNKKSLISQGEKITEFVKADGAAAAGGAEPEKTLLQDAARMFERLYDKKWGGFGGAPKFPSPHNLLFLMRYSLLEKKYGYLKMAENTLSQMFRGGLFDHVGGGFSRYSTDEKWLVPHFEKMLYDNALLSLAYLEAYDITGEKFYLTVAERTLKYILSELKSPEGGFYCAQDADSDAVEGKYYVFTPEEINEVLGEKDAKIICEWFSVTKEGNFEGKNVLNLLANPNYREEDGRVRALCEKLYDYRLERAHLHRDDKALTAWNALAVAALTRAFRASANEAYLEAAQTACGFIKRELIKDGEIKVRWRDGEAANHGQIDDYAFYAYALLELYRATFGIEYLTDAIDVASKMCDKFFDHEKGGFFLYSKDAAPLIARPKETYDGAMPSGNSVAAIVLESLGRLTGEEKWRKMSERQISFLSGAAKGNPVGHAMALIAISAVLYPAFELVCATAESHAPKALWDFLDKNRFFNLSVILKTKENEKELAAAAPFTREYPLPKSGARYYLCQSGACFAPTGNIEELTGLLQKGAP